MLGGIGCRGPAERQRTNDDEEEKGDVKTKGHINNIQ